MAHQTQAHPPDPSILGSTLRSKYSVSGYSLTSEKSRRLPGEGLTWALPSTLTAAFSPEGEAPTLLPYQFQMEEIESFRYRCRVSLTRVGRKAVEEWAGTQGLCPIAEHPGICATLSTHRMLCAR